MAATNRIPPTCAFHLRSRMRMPPEFNLQIQKLNSTEVKVRRQIENQELDLVKQRAALKDLEQHVADQMTTVSHIEDWIAKAQKGIDELTKAKQAVHVQYDLQRLRPFVKLAASKKEKLQKESERVGSAHREVTDRVAALEQQLKELQVDVKEKKEEEEKKKEEAVKGADTTHMPAGSSSSATAAAADSTEEEDNKIKTAEGSLDDLLRELDDGR